MKNALALALTALFLSGQASLAAEPQEERQQSMKSVGQAMGMLAKTAKGEIDYDAVAVEEAFAAMNTAAVNFINQFPEGSETGYETEASPNIWSDRSGFEAAVKKFDTDTANAVTAAPKDIAAFRVEFGKVAQNCKTCHESYRVSKN